MNTHGLFVLRCYALSVLESLPDCLWAEKGRYSASVVFESSTCFGRRSTRDDDEKHNKQNKVGESLMY